MKRKSLIGTNYSSNGLKTLHVLVVDDSPSIRRIHAHMLIRNGHSVVEASNGLEAVTAVKKMFKHDEDDIANGVVGLVTPFQVLKCFQFHNI